MKTIGQYLRNKRKEKGLTIRELSKITRIRENFLRAIEREEWGALPEFTVVAGFVRSVAGALEADRNQTAALLRRDYPPRKPVVQEKEMPINEFRVSPQHVFFAGVGIVVLAIAAYLIAQYMAFTRPPELSVDVPSEGQVVLERQLTVLGKTDPTATVIVNTQPALVAEDGSFSTTIVVNESTSLVEVVATSRAGKETRISRTIKPEFE